MERLKKLETPSEENVPEKPKEKDVLNRSVFPKKGLTVRLMKDSSDKDLVTIHLSIPAWKDTLQDFDVNFPYTGFVKSLNFERLRVVNHVTPVHSDIDKFVKAIFKTNCISGIRADSPFKIKMYKSGALSWDEVTPKLYEALESVFPDLEKPESQQPVTNELEEATAP